MKALAGTAVGGMRDGDLSESGIGKAGNVQKVGNLY
jgi:hypothetical protein